MGALGSCGSEWVAISSWWREGLPPGNSHSFPKSRWWKRTYQPNIWGLKTVVWIKWEATKVIHEGVAPYFSDFSLASVTYMWPKWCKSAMSCEYLNDVCILLLWKLPQSLGMCTALVLCWECWMPPSWGIWSVIWCRVGRSREGLLFPAAAEALQNMRVCIHVVPALVP